MYGHDLALFAGFTAVALAVAFRKPLHAFAGFLAIVLGRRFARGDRIELGGVRGEVLRVGPLTTTLLETPLLEVGPGIPKDRTSAVPPPPVRRVAVHKQHGPATPVAPTPEPPAPAAVLPEAVPVPPPVLVQYA